MKTFFFLSDKLHKKIRIIKSENILVAWSYPDEERMWYDYSFAKREYVNAYKIGEVSELIEKSEVQIRDFIDRGLLDYPSGISYTIASKRPSTMYWSENDVLTMRNRFYELAPKNKYGEPYSNFKLVRKADLMSRMHKDSSYYVNSETGEKIRVWKTF